MRHQSTPTRDSRGLSVPFDGPFFGNRTELSAEEIEFFKQNGFLIKKNLLPPDAVAATLDKAWEYLLGNVPSAEHVKIQRSSPKSWFDPQWGNMSSVPKSGFYEGRQPNIYQGTTVKLHDCGNADYILDLLPNKAEVRTIAHLFLGDKLKPTQRTRGVYAIFPTKRNDKPITGRMLGPHADRVCQQLNVCAYLDEVPPRNGGFTLYPGAHRIMHYAHHCEANWSPKPDYIEYVKTVVREITPFELVGSAGDVIFWHGRMIHSAGIHIGPNIRWAVFGDFCQDRPFLTDDEHREVGQYEWFKDTRLFREDHSPSNDMWKSWNI